MSFSVISPVDGRVYVERSFASPAEVNAALDRARRVWPVWAAVPLAERIELVRAMVDRLVVQAEPLGDELTWQMGRPCRFASQEVRGGFAERAEAMLQLAPEALADVVAPAQSDCLRFVRRVPLGLVLVLAPWNFPWLTAVNTVVPALIAGNVVVLKHANQTPLVPERWKEAADAVGLPRGVLEVLHVTHRVVGELVADPRVDHVAFTGSVEGGRAVHRAAGGTFKTVGLELGGKDPAYVRADADVEGAARQLADGAFFNAGQSCCGIERIYVHRDVSAPFVDALVEEAQGLVLGDPTDSATTLGPVVRDSAAEAILAQIKSAVQSGARALIDPGSFPARERGARYLGPQVLVDVTHAMEVMREETFGPVVGVMQVTSDDEAVERMNDCRYGLTASIWTRDLEDAAQLGNRLETGTFFTNRCDYLDPYLAWTGVKDSGRGCTLSEVGYETLTRPKSFRLQSV